jgi:putative transposase
VQLAGVVPVVLMCRAIGRTPGAYYAWRRRSDGRRARANRRLLVEVRAIHEASGRTYGSPRVWAELRARGHVCSRKRVARLMRQERIRAAAHRRRRPCADRVHDWPPAPNVVARDFGIGAPDRVWLSDITYIPTGEGWLYLGLTMDLYSRRIVGWAAASLRDRRLTLAALEMALGRRRPDGELVHHSDRGGQYACWDYTTKLKRHGIVASMSRTGNPYDNAPMESFIRTLKVELIHRRRFETREEARTAIASYIELFYNCRRRHSALGYLSPAEYEAKGAIPA